jgi:hypothetical protein
VKNAATGNFCKIGAAVSTGWRNQWLFIPVPWFSAQEL